MQTVILILQILVPTILIVLILLKQRGTALGATFGGGGESYSKRRGVEEKIFWATVVLGGLFIVVSLLNLAI